MGATSSSSGVVQSRRLLECGYVRSIAACAVDSDTPTGRLNEVVAAAKPPWWKIDSGVLDGAKLAIRVSGTVRPSAVTKLKSRRISGLCQ